jgi:predicted transcriptional regulator
MDIAKILKDRRIALGISQDDLATHCGFCHRSNISRLEAGRLEWKWRDVVNACQFLKLSIKVE